MKAFDTDILTEILTGNPAYAERRGGADEIRPEERVAQRRESASIVGTVLGPHHLPG